MQVTEDEVGSPVDMAKLYMQARPQWASPSFNREELKPISPVTVPLFNEETPYSGGGNSLSSFKVPFQTFLEFHLSFLFVHSLILVRFWVG